MKAKKCWFLVLFAAVCGAVIVSSVLFASNDYEEKERLVSEEFKKLFKKIESESLVGLNGVGVSVAPLTLGVEKYGLTTQMLQTDTELQLRRNGIKIISDEDLAQEPGGPILFVNVLSKIYEELELAAVYVKVELKQYVLLKRDPTLVCSCDTWREEGVTLVLLKDFKNIRETVKDAVDMFCNDYLAANPKEYSADEKTPRHIETEVGQNFVIALGSNPTTGYSWRLAEPLPRMLKLQGKRYIPAKPQIIGSGGTEKWVFKSVCSGEATIIFEYVRPWEKKTPPVRRQSFSIVAK